MKKEILIVEDNEDLRHLYQRALRNEGFEPSTAMNGQVALDLLSTMPTLPGAIILDLMMPVMDGWTFLREREKVPAVAQIPLIICSAAKEVPPKGIEFLQKPIELPALLRFLDSCFCDVDENIPATDVRPLEF